MKTGLTEKEEGPPDEDSNQARVPSCHLCDLASVGDRTPVRCRVTEGTHVPLFLHNVSFINFYVEITSDL